jgi:hypothetical protein
VRRCAPVPSSQPQALLTRGLTDGTCACNSLCLVAVLVLVRDAQAQHGLRHNDFSRYQ